MSLAPRAHSLCAVASPSPVLAPVTTTVRPERSDALGACGWLQSDVCAWRVGIGGVSKVKVVNVMRTVVSRRRHAHSIHDCDIRTWGHNTTSFRSFHFQTTEPQVSHAHAMLTVATPSTQRQRPLHPRRLQ